jgi:hypothetical protein
MLNRDKKENIKEEIWAEIINVDNGKKQKMLIWWKDNEGFYHDESPNLPIEFRDIVDNAWIRSANKI